MSDDDKKIEIFDPSSISDEGLEYLELDSIPNIIGNPFDDLCDPASQDPALELTKVLVNPNYLHYAVKAILNIELLPYQLVILDTLWNKRLPMLIASRGASKTFCMAVYALLRLIFHPGCKIVICGASFRQSKQTFEYMTEIWNKAPILRDIAGRGKDIGPRRDTDRCTFSIGTSKCYAIPIGSGEKIRGLRANYILADEFSSIDEAIFNLVIQGFAVTTASSSLVDKVKEYAIIKRLKKIGQWTTEMDQLQKSQATGNQIVYTGTSNFSFNHFYKYFKKWHDIIMSKGDPRVLTEIFSGDESLASGFNWKDYAIIRIPYTHIPEGVLDRAIIAQAKATLSHSQFAMEYCFNESCEIIVPSGVKKIKDIQLGDLVFTHNGRFRPVIKVYKRYYDGPIRKISTYGYNQPIICTPEHPFYYNNKWIDAKNLRSYSYLSNLKELNNRTSLYVSDYVDNYVIYNDGDQQLISPSPSRKQTTYTTSKKFKHTIYNKVEIDENFGKVIGYYAAEGSVGANGKSVGFALDGHIDKNLLFFIDDLSESISESFNIKPKLYNKGDNVTSVTINNRLLVDVIKNICPGVCDTKVIDPDILFSNIDFIKGFIKGYWNGDGHISGNLKVLVATCVNRNLLMQVKLCLSLFGISSAFKSAAPAKHGIIKGKVVNRKESHTLVCRGANAKKLYNLINDTNIPYDYKNSYIKNDDSCASFEMIENIEQTFSGFVYNLEVDEDNSYSLPNASVHNCAVFPSDSDGFYKRSTLEAATTHRPILTKEGELVQFSAKMIGDPQKAHVIAIDPAADADNAAVVVLELNTDHRKIVHCWSTNKERYNRIKKEMAKTGTPIEDDYYRYIAKRIRYLMRNFRTEHIMLDKHGGGTAIAEALSSADTYDEGELPIFVETDPSNPTADDMKDGLHILTLVAPTQDFNSEANHGMLKDFQDKVLLFPMFDTIEIEKALQLDKMNETQYLTYEDLVHEIEELKNEITTIIVKPSSTLGKETFDTPTNKSAAGINQKGRLRKDRYSALLYANFYARNKNKDEVFKIEYQAVGGTKETLRHKVSNSNALYYGPGILKFGNNNWNNAGKSSGPRAVRRR